MRFRRKPKLRKGQPHELAWGDHENIGGDHTFPLACVACGRLYDRAHGRTDTLADIPAETLDAQLAAAHDALAGEPCPAR